MAGFGFWFPGAQCRVRWRPAARRAAVRGRSRPSNPRWLARPGAGHRLGQWHGLRVGHAPVGRAPVFHAQVVFGCNFLRNHQVVAGLGFARVGHGGGAHLEVALGRGQLFRHCGFLGLHEGQRVLRGQHIKVGLAHAHQQVLVAASSCAWATSTPRSPCSTAMRLAGRYSGCDAFTPRVWVLAVRSRRGG